MELNCRAFRLHAVCADEQTYATLEALGLPHLVLIALPDLEAAYPELQSVKRSRSRTEYYWTMTPATCRFVLEREPDVELITRLDADLMFYADPGPLYDELGDASILLTPHRIAPEFKDATDRQRQLLGGRFNVQFEVFRRDRTGMSALRWWHDRCVEWCYDRFEPGRYGDQGYLDDWETRFNGVRACRHPGAGLAPWNVSGHALSVHDGRIEVDGEPLIFHHFQSLELHRATPTARRFAKRSRAYRHTDGPVPLVWTTGWRLNEQQLKVLWDPYVARLSAAYGALRGVGSFSDDLSPLRPPRTVFHVLRRRLPRRLRDLYWRSRSAIWLRRNGSVLDTDTPST